MQVVSSVDELRSAIARQKRQGKSIAFVPTMGNLHQGHLQLINTARQQADFVVASIFVNPLQFGQNEDYDEYPRTHEQDTQQLNEQGCHLLFLPSVETMYPLPFGQQTRVQVPGLSDMLCGASRPGHFVGVSTVVCKLFNLVQPDKAVFGEKDFQQLMVIRRMVDDLCMPVRIIGAAIVRETDGLAMSSRNAYLDPSQRQLASALYNELKTIKQRILAGNQDFAKLEKQASDNLNRLGFKTDYIAIRRSDDLQKPHTSDNGLVILAAAYLGTTRLIDNLVVSQ